VAARARAPRRRSALMICAPSLSVCCITRDPGPRVAALLGDLRAVADEIVVAADSRVDEGTLAHYAMVADRLLRIEVEHADRHLAWLHAQCSCDWIFRIDGDEVVSPQLVKLLPQLVADRSALQCLFPRRWLYGDAGRWLDELPWWPDYQLRLVRNDGLLRFRGLHHTVAEPVRPARYVQAPIYHLDLLLSTFAERAAKARHYDTLHPHLTAPGGRPMNECFYLPEASRQHAPVDVPDTDRAAIERVLVAEALAPEPPALAAPPPVTPAADCERLLPDREVDPAGCRARIMALERRLRMAAGERRTIHFAFTNEGSENWPWDAELGPPIRATYRVLDTAGRVVIGDGPRTAFPCAVGPGEQTVVPLDVIAPVRPGRYVVEADAIHEGVRWFDCPGRCEIEVAPPAGWQCDASVPARAGLRGRVARGARRCRRGPGVPRVLHRVWLGGRPMPQDFERYGDTWRAHHPGWEHRLWRDADVASLVPAEALARCRSPSEASDLARYAILAREGGVYVDTDFECRRAIDPLLEGLRAFTAYETPGNLGTGIMGARPADPLFTRAAGETVHTAGLGPSSIEATGPGYLRLLAAGVDHLTVLDAGLFYPYRWDEPDRRAEAFPEAYAVHHWGLSWRVDERSSASS